MRFLPLLFIAIAPLAVAATADEAVDPALPGTWKAVVRNETGEWTFTFKLEAGGAYRTAIKGPAAIPDEVGKFSGAKGKWAVEKASGQSDGGTYALPDPDTLALTGRGGTLVWKRVGGAPAAAEAPRPGKAPESPARPLLELPGTPGGMEYLEGVECLERADWAAATASLAKALEKEPENVEYYVARGAAFALGEKVAEAAKDLDRALRLSPNHKGAKLWMASAVGMQGLFFQDTQFFPYATNDAYESLVRRVTREYGRPYGGNDHGHGPDDKALHEGALKRFPELGRRFARRVLSQRYAAGFLARKARERYDKGEYDSARASYDLVLASYPDDPETLYFHACCLLGLGNPADARSELARVLTLQPFHRWAYAAKALAAARMGDVARARRDLATADKVDPGHAAKMRPEIEKALASLPTAAEGPNEALFEKVRSKPEEARALVLATNGRRRRNDELYQDRLKELSDAVKAGPNNPDALASLGDYLQESADVMGERAEPRGPLRPYRVTSAAIEDEEIDQARALLDQALAINPGHVLALAGRASVAIRRGQWADAENLIRRALKIQPGHPRVLETFARVLEHAACMRQLRASDLRETKSWSDSRYVYWRYPSAADLEKADEYDRQAEQLYALASAHLEQGARQDTVDGLYCKALQASHARDYAGLRDILRESVRRKPDDLRARRMLMTTCSLLGDVNAALEEQSVVANLFETTAVPLLRVVWDCVRTTRWDAARRVLARAAEIDPADPRVAAYLAIVDAAEGKVDAAAQGFRAALALSKARAALAGVPSEGYLSPKDYGFDLAVLSRFGSTLGRGGRFAEAEKVFEEAVALEARAGREDFQAPVFAAHLPGGNPQMNPNEETENVASLVAWARLGLGAAEVKLEKYKDAVGVLQGIQAVDSSIMVNGVGMDRLEKPKIHGCLWLAYAYLGMNDLVRAKLWAGKLPKKRLGVGPSLAAHAELEEEGTRLNEEISKRLSGR